MKLSRHLPALTASFLWNLIASVVTQGTTLILILFLSNLLGPSNLARYIVAQTTILTLAAVAQAGLAFTATNYVARHRHNEPDQAGAVGRFALVTALTAGAIIAIIVLSLSQPLAAYLYGDASLRIYLLAAALAIPFAAAGLIQNAILSGLEQFRTLASGALLSAALTAALVVGGAMWGGSLGAALGLLAATLGRAVLMHLLLMPAWRRMALGNLRGRLSGTWRKIRHFALPAGLAGLTLTPAVWLTNGLLVNQVGLQALGLFAAAFTVKTLVTFVPIQIGSVFLPRYVVAHRNDPKQARRDLRQAVLLAGSIAAVLGGVAAALGSGLMALFGPEFGAGGGVLAWLMLAAVVESIATIWSYRLAVEQRMWSSFLGYTLPKDILLVASAAVLVPTFGAQGLAYAHLLSWLYAIVALTLIPNRRSPAAVDNQGISA